MSQHSKSRGAGLTLLPAKPGTCPECASEHQPDWPHNAQSLYYQMRFTIGLQRAATWRDAIAHCSDELKAKWEEQLRRLGITLDGSVNPPAQAEGGS